VPMYFIKRGDKYIDVSGQSFRDLLAGKLASQPGERATLSDWSNHVSTIFPEVRLKRYLEMRGSDVSTRQRLSSLPAFWVGLFYDEKALDACWQIVKDWTADERQKLRDDVPKLGFAATIRGRTLLAIAAETLKLSRGGLSRRARMDAGGQDETLYLEPLEDLVQRGTTPAEELLAKYNGPWGKSVEPVYKDCAY
jgi:glutamate--cysteine ligase